MKNVLLVTYYWPPAGGPGVQRTLKFVKYMREYGWNPIVLTVANNQQFGVDETLLADVPKDLAVFKDKILLQKNQESVYEEGKKSFLNTFKHFVRGNVLIPDSRVFWYWQCRPSLKKIFSTWDIDLTFVSGPPQTAHLIGLYIKKKFKQKVVHDFRDPWTDIYFLKKFHRLKMATKFDMFLEQKVVKNANGIVSVDNEIIRLLNKKKINLNSVEIRNGFDHPINNFTEKKIKTLLYTGSISEFAVPFNLLNILKEKNIRLRIIGKVHKKLVDYVDKHNISNIIIENKMSHDEIIIEQKRADALLLVIPNVKNNEGILTGKIFEYLAANRPIFGIGPENGSAAQIINKSGLGLMVDYKDLLTQKLDYFLENKWVGNSNYIKQYHRKELTEKLCRFFDVIHAN